MLVREGGRLSLGAYGESLVMARRDIDSGTVTAADQLLVGLNRTRHAYNKRMRELCGHADVFPQAGDKLVCLKNNRAKGLLNGGIWLVKTIAPTRKKKLALGASIFLSLPFVLLGGWPAAGFIGISVAIFYFALRANFRAACAYEDVELTFLTHARHGRRDYRPGCGWAGVLIQDLDESK